MRLLRDTKRDYRHSRLYGGVNRQLGTYRTGFKFRMGAVVAAPGLRRFPGAALAAQDAAVPVVDSGSRRRHRLDGPGRFPH